MLLANANPLNQPIEFTQGDDVTLDLIATDDQGLPVNLTNAVLSTQILGPNPVGPVTFPDGQHTLADQTTNPGEFSLTLSSSDTLSCGEGLHKQILTEAITSGQTLYYRGINLLTVNPNIPLQ